MSLTFQEKVERCNAFWAGAPVERPMIGFFLGGWFPFQEYTAMRKFRGQTRLLTADQIVPAEFMNDYDNIVAQWEKVDDDVIRSVAPIPPFPWLESMLGLAFEVGEDSAWVREDDFDFADIGKLDFSKNNPWRRKYLEFAGTLKDHFGDRAPVGQPIMRGVSDLIPALRTSTRMIFDLYDHGEEIQRLAGMLTDFMVQLVKDQQDVTGPLNGGTALRLTPWGPGPDPAHAGRRLGLGLSRSLRQIFERGRAPAGGCLPLQPDSPPYLIALPGRPHLHDRALEVSADQQGCG